MSLKEEKIEIDRTSWEKSREWLLIKKMAPYKQRYHEILSLLGDLEEKEIALVK